MAGLKASTEENLVREKERNMFHFTGKNTRMSRGMCDHKTYCAFSLSVNITNSVQQHQRQSENETL
jgi:hypothetical protein